MKEAIIEKLNGHINSGITTESDAVYVLVQTWKLLEHSDLADRYPTLRFYRDWVVHPKLNRSAGANRLLEELNDAIERYERMEDGDAFVHRISEAISFRRLRCELDLLAGKLAIDKKFLVDPSWRHFVTYLIRILMDLPLIPREELSKVCEFVFKAKTSSQDYRNYPDVIAVWIIRLRDGSEHCGPVSGS